MLWETLQFNLGEHLVSLPAHVKLAFSLRLRFSIVPPSDASPISVKLLALSVDIILGKNFIES